MRDLSELRSDLDRIDSQLLKLYLERLQVTGEVAEYKIAHDRPVYDPVREAEKLSALEAQSPEDELTRLSVRELFEQIMAVSRKQQYARRMAAGDDRPLPFTQVESLFEGRCKVVCQGEAGAYSQSAMEQFFGPKVHHIFVPSFRDAMVAIEEGEADYAVLPIENSTAGVVSQIYDLLVEFENYIVGEQIIPIRHCLMVKEGTRLEDIRRVYSHPQSLAQSRRFLLEHPGWETVSLDNNAFAAARVAKGEEGAAAIAGEAAARVYGLKVLAEGINQAENNSTRFIVVTNRKIYRKGADKISLCLEVAHKSGSLYHILSHFIYNHLNMTKIESRPIEDRSWEYRFFIDFEGSLSDSGVRNALRGLRDEARSLKILGNY